jgi:hypothetical protein
LAKGDLAAAEAYARKELELIDPADETIDTTYDSLSVILREQGRLDDAQQVLKDGIEATGSDSLRERLAALEAPKQADAQSWSGGYSFTRCGGPRDQG